MTEYSDELLSSPGEGKKKRRELMGSESFSKLTRTPSSDLPQLFRKSSRSSSSRFLGLFPRNAKLVRLPALTTVSPEKLEDLVIKKINQCLVMFDFSDPSSETEQKEIKQDALIELVEFFFTERGFVPTSLYKDIFNMISKNIFRPLPTRYNPLGLEYDPEEDEPLLEDAWPHLQIVYEFFLRFVESHEFDPMFAKQYVTRNFIGSLIDLFASEDNREREYLKTLLHRLYGKFLGHRSFIRKTIKNIFVSYTYENEWMNGIPELLEILGSIVNGFALPLKEEHTDFLLRSLLPLHTTKTLALFHSQLIYCVSQYISKDPTLTYPVVKRLIRYWPVVNSTKELLFLGELEEILSIVEEQEYDKISDLVFKQYAKCISSCHFQVAEKALSLWTSESIYALLENHVESLFPIVFESLYHIAQTHWHKAIRPMAWYSLKVLRDVDEATFYHVIDEFEQLYEMQQECDELNEEENSLKVIHNALRNRKLIPIERETIEAMIELANGWQIPQYEEEDEVYDYSDEDSRSDFSNDSDSE